MTPVDKYALHPRLTFAESSILKSRNVVPKLEFTSGSSKFLIQIHLLLYSSMFDEILFDFMDFVLWFCFGVDFHVVLKCYDVFVSWVVWVWLVLGVWVY